MINLSRKIDKELIAPCGMNCSICVSYFGYTMSDKKRKMKCPGCIPRGKHCSWIKQKCKKLAKHELDYCYECGDFPCYALEQLDKSYRQKYNMSMIENLNYIKEQGIEKFLQQQREKYTCPECGSLICVHTNKCYNCE